MSGERSFEQFQQVMESLARTEDYLSLRVRQEKRLAIQTLLEEWAADISAEERAKLRFEQGLIDAYENNYREALSVWDATGLVDSGTVDRSLVDAAPKQSGSSKRDVRSVLSAYEAAIAAYEHSSPGDPAEGVVLGLLNRYPEAIAAFSQVLADRPNDSHAWYNKAITLRKLGRDQAAIAAFDVSLDIDPDATKAHYGKAMLLCELNRHGKAAAAWDDLLSLQPHRLEGLFAQGLSLTYLGQYREAIAAVGDVLGLDPDDQDVLQYQGYAFRKLRRYKDAVEAYGSALDFRQNYRGMAHRQVSYPNFVCQQLSQLKAAIAPKEDASEATALDRANAEDSGAKAPEAVLNASTSDANTSAPNPFDSASSAPELSEEPGLPLLIDPIEPKNELKNEPKNPEPELQEPEGQEPELDSHDQEPDDLTPQAELEEAAIAPAEEGAEVEPPKSVELETAAIAEASNLLDDMEQALLQDAEATQEREDEAVSEALSGDADTEPPPRLDGDHEALYNQGNASVRQGRYEEAIALYDAVLTIQPGYQLAAYNKACCYALWGRPERAVQQLEEAIALYAGYREKAMADDDFASLRDDERFKSLANRNAAHRHK